MSKQPYCILLITCFVLLACGGKKKKSMAGQEEVNLEEFLEAYPTLTVPFSYGDSSFPVKENDSLLIAPEIFHKFVPDSVTASVFPATSKPKFYPVGAINNGKEELYLITRGITPARKILLITAYDKSKKFLAGFPIIKLDKNTKVDVNVTIDSRLNINKEITQTLSNGIEISGHDVYVLNKAAKKFMLIMTDSLGDGFTELINPLDTLSRKQKYSADYGEGKMNLISIRDGQREGRFKFFIHLEKNNKECVGELKGEAVFTSENVAEYRQGGDPCILKFVFSKNAVTLEEVEGCGSRLGALQCSFNDVYPKKKDKKTESKKKKAA